MSKPYKFGWFPDGEIDTRYEPPHTWAIETTSGPNRLVAAPRSNQVELLLALAREMAEPFFVLYVLVVPGTDDEPGRYESSELFDHKELGTFLLHYKDFFENDGRHNLWVRSEDNSMLIYDRHNVIYAYGEPEKFVAILTAYGLEKVDDIRFPDPHSHHYNAEYDADQISILKSRDWIHSPLRSGDENPS